MGPIAFVYKGNLAQFPVNHPAVTWKSGRSSGFGSRRDRPDGLRPAPLDRPRRRSSRVRSACLLQSRPWAVDLCPEGRTRPLPRRFHPRQGSKPRPPTVEDMTVTHCCSRARDMAPIRTRQYPDRASVQDGTRMKLQSAKALPSKGNSLS